MAIITQSSEYIYQLELDKEEAGLLDRALEESSTQFQRLIDGFFHDLHVLYNAQDEESIQVLFNRLSERDKAFIVDEIEQRQP